MQRRDYIILKKVIMELTFGEDLVANVTLDSFLEDEILKRAAAMTVINVGELIKNITEETREKYRNIPWKAVAGMRDITAHKYQTLRMEDVYNTLIKDFPGLKEKLTGLLKESC